MKEKHVVTIAGTSLTVITEEDGDYVNSIARLLDRRVNDMMLNKNKCSKMDALILLSLDYLDSTIKLKAEVEELKEKLNELKEQY
ncbi:MAG: cell division protein ZapA [Clostridia bacterium]|nr:cell division protein ZapA [Clostridia bacterium]